MKRGGEELFCFDQRSYAFVGQHFKQQGVIHPAINDMYARHATPAPGPSGIERVAVRAPGKSRRAAMSRSVDRSWARTLAGGGRAVPARESLGRAAEAGLEAARPVAVRRSGS